MKIDIVRWMVDPVTSEEMAVCKEYERSIVPRIGEKVADYALEGRINPDGAVTVDGVYYKYDENICEVVLEKFMIPKSDSENMEYWIRHYEKYGWKRY